MDKNIIYYTLIILLRCTPNFADFYCAYLNHITVTFFKIITQCTCVNVAQCLLQGSHFYKRSKLCGSFQPSLELSVQLSFQMWNMCKLFVFPYSSDLVSEWPLSFCSLCMFDVEWSSWIYFSVSFLCYFSVHFSLYYILRSFVDLDNFLSFYNDKTVFWVDKIN